MTREVVRSVPAQVVFVAGSPVHPRWQDEIAEVVIAFAMSRAKDGERWLDGAEKDAARRADGSDRLDTTYRGNRP